MLTASDVLDRLRDQFEWETDTAMAVALGVTKSTLSGWRGRNSIPFEICVQLAEDKGLSLDWILLGRGPQKLDVVAEPVARYEVSRMEVDPVLSDIQAWIRAWWVKATGEERIWFQVQLNRCFPERVAWGK